MNYLITIAEFISFGPCCLGAELLQALELRTCSYGFDWSRSGSLEHKDFLKQGSSEFFKTRVMNPVMRLNRYRHHTNRLRRRQKSKN